MLQGWPIVILSSIDRLSGSTVEWMGPIIFFTIVDEAIVTTLLEPMFPTMIQLLYHGACQGYIVKMGGVLCFHHQVNGAVLST